MEKIYDQAKDKNVAAVVVYVSGAEIGAIQNNTEGAKAYAYADEDCTIKMKSSELKDAFIKRAIVNGGSMYLIPIAFNESSTAAGIIIYDGTQNYTIEGIED